MFSEEGNFENHDIFFTARCENVYIADCAIVGNVLANTDNREIWKFPLGRGYSTNVWEKVSCRGFETLTLFRTKKS